MSTKEKTKTRKRRCSECGELKEEVLGRQRLCEQCEDGKDYCTICDEWADRSWGGGCRHVGWNSEDGISAGCGTDHMDAEDHKESFMLLLDFLAPVTEYLDRTKPAMLKILACIEKNNFWTQWHGPMIGGPPDLSMLHSNGGKGDRFFALTICEVRASQQLGWGDSLIRQMQLGMAWLTSLDAESVKANKLTAGWIREWMAAKPGAALNAIRTKNKRALLIAFLGKCAKSPADGKKIIKMLGIPNGHRSELDKVSIERLRSVALKIKRGEWQRN